MSVALTLGLLAFFKYSNFAASTLAFLVHPLGWHPPERILTVVLPIGVSFYSFQAISYVVDVYRGHVKACRKPRDFLVYITLFPQLIAGPIQRAGHLLPQIQRRRVITQSEVAEGLYLVLWGYAKKTVIADNLGLKVDRIFSQGSFTTTSVLIGAIGYAFQIYADFSGYTDIARGVARWLGFELSLNFDHPYFAANPQEFWRRWHISLSTWLRDYLYISLGGSRGGRARTYRNLFITMVLGGLWHGAAWNFVLWGGYQGALLAGHRFWRERFSTNTHEAGRGAGSPFKRALSMVAMFVFTVYGWLLFRVRDADQLAAAHRALAHWHFTPDFWRMLARMLPYIGLLLAVDAGTYLSGDAFFFARRSPVVTALFYLFLIYTIIILGISGGEHFIYFAF